MKHCTPRKTLACVLTRITGILYCRYFNLLALVPVVVLQPVLLGIPGTWEARNAKFFGLEFVVEALVLIAAWVLSRVASCYSVQWQKSSERILADLDVQVRQTRCPAVAYRCRNSFICTGYSRSEPP